MARNDSRAGGLWRLALGVAGPALIGAVLLPASAAAAPTPIPPPKLAGIPSLPGPLAPSAQPAPQGQVLLRATPDVGKVGTKFTLSGSGLPANREIDIVWSTVNGSYIMNPLPDTVEHFGRQYDEIGVVLAKARTDATGQLKVDLAAPEDYGELHDISAVADGLKLGKGGFRISRYATLSPREGPIGTPITIKVTGLGWKPFESTAAVLYDNKYAGFISATTTRGTATAQIRAAGPVGKHRIEVTAASAAVNYLNIEQSPVYFVGRFPFGFTVTKDDGPAPASVDWPERVEPTITGKTTVTAASATGVAADLASRSGPILSKVELTATGLSPGAPVDLEWVTAVGARASPSGWSLTTLPLGQATAAADGSLKTAIEVPDNLGGWHAVKVLQDGKVKAEVPYFVERSLVGITPIKVKANRRFTIQVKGVGWTELDNGFAVTYDNGYIGYACGFNSDGDVTMKLFATGGPGTHLIDLYPMIYKGKGNKDNWLTQVPMLNFKQDAPGLALGYRLPAIRLAIQIVE